MNNSSPPPSSSAEKARIERIRTDRTVRKSRTVDTEIRHVSSKGSDDIDTSLSSRKSHCTENGSRCSTRPRRTFANTKAHS
jgi:hypothetical protein